MIKDAHDLVPHIHQKVTGAASSYAPVLIWANGDLLEQPVKDHGLHNLGQSVRAGEVPQFII